MDIQTDLQIENARPKNVRWSKMQGRIMQDGKMRDQYARVENAEKSSMESLFANMCAKANVRM